MPKSTARPGRRNRAMRPLGESLENRLLLSVTEQDAFIDIECGTNLVDGSEFYNPIHQPPSAVAPISVNKTITSTGKDSQTVATASTSLVTTFSGNAGSATVTGSYSTPAGTKYNVADGDYDISYAETVQNTSNSPEVFTVNYNIDSHASDGTYTPGVPTVDFSVGGSPVTNASGKLTLTIAGGSSIGLGTSVSNETSSADVNGVNDQSSCTFNWTLASAPPPPPPPPTPTATIAINDTATTSDNVTVFNPESTGEAATQSIPAKITNTSSTQQTFTLLVSSSTSNSSPATLSETSVTLMPGASTGEMGTSPDVVITPKADSSKVNDVRVIVMDGSIKVAEDDMTIVEATFTSVNKTNSLDIKYQDTPAGTPDRIPPRVNTPVYVGISPSLTGSGESLAVEVTGRSANTGQVTINGIMYGTFVTSSGIVNLSSPDGTTQTSPGHSGQLTFDVLSHNAVVLQSHGFSVSAIPIDFHQTGAEILPGGVLHFDYAWNSDSANISDLDQVWIGEYVSYPNNGTFKGPGKPWEGNFLDPTITPAPSVLWGALGKAPNGDTHSPPGGILPMAGPADSFTAIQFYGFHDFRSDSRPFDGKQDWQVNLDGPISITRSVVNIGTTTKPIWLYRISKSGLTDAVVLN